MLFPLLEMQLLIVSYCQSCQNRLSLVPYC